MRISICPAGSFDCKASRQSHVSVNNGTKTERDVMFIVSIVSIVSDLPHTGPRMLRLFTAVFFIMIMKLWFGLQLWL